MKTTEGSTGKARSAGQGWTCQTTLGKSFNLSACFSCDKYKNVTDALFHRKTGGAMTQSCECILKVL